MNADGSNLHLLTDTGAQFQQIPIWSPDGSRIVFKSADNTAMKIDVIRPDGSDLHRLSGEDDTDFGLVWSPDSRFLAFFFWPKNQEFASLYVMDIARNIRTKIADVQDYGLNIFSTTLYWIP